MCREPCPIGFGPDEQQADDAARQQQPAQDDVALLVARERRGRVVSRGGIEPPTLRFSVGERSRPINDLAAADLEKRAGFALWMAKLNPPPPIRFTVPEP
jgi:hypothetical protein